MGLDVLVVHVVVLDLVVVQLLGIADRGEPRMVEHVLEFDLLERYELGFDLVELHVVELDELELGDLELR